MNFDGRTKKIGHKRCSKGLKRSKFTGKCEDSKKCTYGSYAQVYHGTAYKTTGGLTRDDLIQVIKHKSKKTGITQKRIVSKAKSSAGKKIWSEMKKDQREKILNALAEGRKARTGKKASPSPSPSPLKNKKKKKRKIIDDDEEVAPKEKRRSARLAAR
jgi:hypothetical protein